jgi:hypothetical protein
LGEKTDPTSSVTRRTAALTCRPLGKSFVEAVKDCEKIYDARSRYVHEGKNPARELEKLATTICREIVFCLFRIQRDRRMREPGFRKMWVKSIDFIVGAFDSNRLPLDADLREIGVAMEGEFGLGDFDKLLKDKGVES